MQQMEEVGNVFISSVSSLSFLFPKVSSVSLCLLIISSTLFLSFFCKMTHKNHLFNYNTRTLGSACRLVQSDLSTRPTEEILDLWLSKELSAKTRLHSEMGFFLLADSLQIVYGCTVKRHVGQYGSVNRMIFAHQPQI